MGVDILSDSSCRPEPVSYAAVEEDGTIGLVIEVFDDLDKVGADVVLLLDLCVDATGVVCHQLSLLSTDLHAVAALM